MIDRRLFRLPGTKRLMLMLAGLTFLQAFVILFQGKYLADALVNSWHMKPLQTIIYPMTLFAVAFVVRHLLNLLNTKIVQNYSGNLSEEIRSQLLDKVYNSGPQMISERGTGNLVTASLDGIDLIENYFKLIFTKMMNMSIIPPVLLVYIYFQNIASGITLTIIVPLIILFMIILGLAAQSKADEQYDQYTILSNHFLDALRGLPTLKMLGLSKRYVKNIYTVSDEYRRRTMNTLRIAILSTFALDWLTTLGIAILAVFLGLGLINNQLPLFPALVTLILAPEYFLPLRDFSNDYHATLDGKNALTNIFSILDRKDTEDTDKLEKLDWDENSNFEINNLQFNYDDEDKTADASLDIDHLKLSGFDNVGVIGKSGSGKSTLIRVIGGFLTPENSSDISINGQKVPHFTQRNWQKELTFLPQSPYLFSGTLADNIAFYKPEASQEEIEAAADKAGLKEFIDTLKDGYQTLIGEGGRGISGGQQQRIMIARAFLADDRHILIFDEPTAHLDIETEYALKKPMEQLFKDHLVIFATHRLHWIKEMDYVIVMDDGEIVEQGTPIELRSHQGAYSDLIENMRGETL
ncbi:thiol reductant ABC exporter subunit CydD [Companilactobacillus sp.]|jgi:ATP-binding cassette subfamily C protein CydD|uniref:thiol reductant ABC exporter subunit CydD n=1 Tax=Companilactobacillus sp. TaxID=2767905 RepID=UPI0025C34C0D|nr:thiol reductant ABC exporter subunit CydD [Companilactobacillus sp.]MCH4009360.1 thiol reductant ABC exporter subunit CydD [Companilactobacillus sp.]MCH4050461.1 thiol reductant ABC exporter subunit CydD [Companilactobacillus sp.]MCH4077302.1 thiol reductant ABC exporter subunit CydD [Companilactobacillus sp.]MCH4125878.1 thiol reductant ABC exporter subunit CydD [Companilactobacillus sp.]MCI1311587.1 thiol reductant ABC exporter subunit CydD [Companilactobacillus sp.]